jgi:hypothetical protein
MKKYTIHFQGQKWRGNEGGSDPVLVDEWQDAIQSDCLPAIWHLTDFVYPKHGIPGAHFSYVPGQPGLFTSTRTEDRKGFATRSGKYLVRVDVQITYSRNNPSTFTGTFSLPSA